jgi:glucose-1-phosphate cytidylyltransferase
MTAGRVERIERYVRDERFLVTYGDGLADIDVTALLDFHATHGREATLTTVRPTSRFGLVDADEHGVVTRFREKPQADGWVNAGFFVFEPSVFGYLRNSDHLMLEHEPLTQMAVNGQLATYRHDGFWQPMDTSREHVLLNELWNSGEAPWAVWNRRSAAPAHDGMAAAPGRLRAVPVPRGSGTDEQTTGRVLSADQWRPTSG